MIERIQTTESITEIFADVPEDWKQWVVENCGNSKIYIISESNIGFVIAINSVLYPLCDYFTIVLAKGDCLHVVRALCEMAKKEGAKSVVEVIGAGDELPEGFEVVSTNIRINV